LALQFKSEEELKAWLKASKAAGAAPKAETVGLAELLDDPEEGPASPGAEVVAPSKPEAAPVGAPGPRKDLNYRPKLPPRVPQPEPEVRSKGWPWATIFARLALWTVFIAFQVVWASYVADSVAEAWNTEVWLTWGFGATAGAAFVMVFAYIFIAAAASLIPD